jgi:predicted flap endonuclease-1-like 5' DNA nuclease
MMSHYLLELVLWMLLAFFIGCVFGYLCRLMFGGAKAEVLEPAAVAPPSVAPAAAPIAVPAAAPLAPKAAGVAPPAGKMARPKGISAARGGKADKLQRISGVGPKNEKVLHNLGFFHFDQIAAWTPEEIEWVDDHLKFNGRIKREGWTRQCKLLAAGKEEEFSKLFGTGGMKNKAGHTQSGNRSRK